MKLPDADYYYRIFKSAEAQVRNGLGIRQSWSDEDQDELAGIEAELGTLDAAATNRDLAFWQSKQADELFIALEKLRERLTRESGR